MIASSIAITFLSLWAGLPIAAETVGINMLVDSDFSAGLEAWTTHPPALEEKVTFPAAGTARIVRTGAAPRWQSLVQRFAVQPGERFVLHAEIRGQDLPPDAMFGTAMHFLDADGTRVGDVSAFGFAGIDGWRPVVCRGEAPAGSAHLSVGMNTRGAGTFEVRGLRLERLPSAPAPPGPDETAVITVTDTVTVPALIGFGAEDDGWFYNPHNAERGVTEADHRVREERITWMQPDWIRSFLWIADWNPSLDLETFDWDTPNMQSQYRTLDLYQRLGARVTVCHTEWGAAQVWQQPEAYARAIGALMEHLIVTRGYSCIRDWTLTNEPNLFLVRQEEGGWDTFVRLHALVAAEFDRRGLDLNIVGSDDGESLLWFNETLQDDTLFALSGLYASHAYFSAASFPFVRAFYRDRLDGLRGRDPVKPFVMAEFGFQDARTQPPSLNPLMEEYAYAMLTHRAIIAGLNEGVAGFNIWCMHEVYYPGGQIPMNFGLWHFVDRDSEVRPVYHSIAAFTRHTQAGDRVYRCDASHPDTVDAARVGEVLFWVNDNPHPQRIAVRGMRLGAVHAFTDPAPLDDRDEGAAVPVTPDEDGTIFVAPAQSFGWATGEGAAGE